MAEREKLALEVKAWRAEAGFTAETAAKLLGIPKRTYEGIEQGRGFPYPVLLRIAIESKAPALQAMLEISQSVARLVEKPGRKV